MRVTFKKSGGYAGLPGQQQQLEFDTASAGSEELPAGKAQELERLVAAARSSSRDGLFEPQPPVANQVRDGFQYDLTIEDDEGRHSVTVRDGNISAEAEPLIRWLNRELNETLKKRKLAREQSD